MNHPPQPYHSRDEIERVVRRFEDCTLAAGEFRHREHLVVVLWYLSQSDAAASAAARMMREGLYRFLDHHGVDRQKYHETITLFWIRRVRAFLEQAEGRGSLAELANELIETCADASLLFTYYSRELIASSAARAAWIEPDLQPLDF